METRKTHQEWWEHINVKLPYKEAAAAALVNAISTIDKAASKGVYHKNNAARKVSNLSKAVNSIA